MPSSALLAFALKPAPVQATWLGVNSTTGIPTVDYYIGDTYSPCPGTEPFFAETVYRLPRISGSYRPGSNLPVAPSPYFTNGFITFGCYNDPRKITRDVVQVWSVLLHLVPTSQLLLKYHRLENPALQTRLLHWFTDSGIARERVRFAAASKPIAYLASWSEVDIALDPFPYNGGTTTLDALWMGVPVVTLAGLLPTARCAGNIVAAAGLPVAYTAEEYIQTAMFLAESIPKTPEIRQTVRQAIAGSPLMDERGLVRSLEAAYRDMWIKWCQSRP